MKTLVAYFSASGVTKQLARKIEILTEGDLFEIEPRDLYTKEDLDWMDPNSRSSIEMKDKSSRPEIKSKVDDMSKYDVIYLGFPIWWYVAPTIINTFLESYDFTGKTIILFATSGGSGIGNTVEELKVSAPKAIFKDAQVLNDIDSGKLAEWVNETNNNH